MTTQWVPVEDGDVLPEKFGKDFQVSGNGSELTMASEGTVIWADLPDDLRLCRLVEVDAPNSSMIETVREAVWREIDVERNMNDVYTARLKNLYAALEWLDKQVAP